MLKHKFLEKKANFPVKKRLWPSFSRLFDCDKPEGTNCYGPKGILISTVEAIGSFQQHLRDCWKLIFLKKKGSLSSEKNFLAYFSRSIEHDKSRETIYKGTQGILTITVDVIRSIL